MGMAGILVTGLSYPPILLYDSALHITENGR